MNKMRKIGSVLWEPTYDGFMKPRDLVEVSEIDLRSLNTIYQAMVAYRRLPPILHLIQTTKWENPRSIIHFLKASLEVRTDARAMRASNDWTAFWNNLN